MSLQQPRKWPGAPSTCAYPAASGFFDSEPQGRKYDNSQPTCKTSLTCCQPSGLQRSDYRGLLSGPLYQAECLPVSRVVAWCTAQGRLVFLRCVPSPHPHGSGMPHHRGVLQGLLSNAINVNKGEGRESAFRRVLTQEQLSASACQPATAS